MTEEMVRLDYPVAKSVARTIDLLAAATGQTKARIVNDSLALGALNLGLLAELPELPVMRRVGRPKKNTEED